MLSRANDRSANSVAPGVYAALDALALRQKRAGQSRMPTGIPEDDFAASRYLTDAAVPSAPPPFGASDVSAAGPTTGALFALAANKRANPRDKSPRGRVGLRQQLPPYTTSPLVELSSDPFAPMGHAIASHGHHDAAETPPFVSRPSSAYDSNVVEFSNALAGFARNNTAFHHTAPNAVAATSGDAISPRTPQQGHMRRRSSTTVFISPTYDDAEPVHSQSQLNASGRDTAMSATMTDRALDRTSTLPRMRSTQTFEQEHSDPIHEPPSPTLHSSGRDTAVPNEPDPETRLPFGSSTRVSPAMDHDEQILAAARAAPDDFDLTWPMPPPYPVSLPPLMSIEADISVTDDNIVCESGGHVALTPVRYRVAAHQDIRSPERSGETLPALHKLQSRSHHEEDDGAASASAYHLPPKNLLSHDRSSVLSGSRLRSQGASQTPSLLTPRSQSRLRSQSGGGPLSASSGLSHPLPPVLATFEDSDPANRSNRRRSAVSFTSGDGTGEESRFGESTTNVHAPAASPPPQFIYQPPSDAAEGKTKTKGKSCCVVM
jgi:hypothetical protein